uniref:Uncharacterized protein n=1 Tax=Nelumbo nucifera TaxID=4432 RepID=A0A822XIV6_NELNU|nr:TPA_asm: hypothetical protein HUJ06_021395 [Nelumbo nucifera]
MVGDMLQERKSNANGGLIALWEFFGQGKKQVICLPEGIRNTGWNKVLMQIYDLLMALEDWNATRNQG